MPRPYRRQPKPSEIERQGQAVELLKAGLTYEQIGAELHCSSSTAWHAVQAAFKSYAKDHGIEEAFATDVLRIETAIRAMWPRVLAGDDDGAMLSLDRLLRRRARMYGYDAPTKVKVDGDLTVTVDDTSERARALVGELEAYTAGIHDASASEATSGNGALPGP